MGCVRAGGGLACQRDRNTVFVRSLGQALVMITVDPPRLLVPCRTPGLPRAAAGVQGPPCVGGSEPSQWLPSEDAVEAGSTGSLPRQKRLVRCAWLSQPPGRLQTGQQNGGEVGLEPVPVAAGAGVRRTTGASTAAPPPGHGAVATQGGLGPCITQHGSLPFRASSGPGRQGGPAKSVSEGVGRG